LIALVFEKFVLNVIGLSPFDDNFYPDVTNIKNKVWLRLLLNVRVFLIFSIILNLSFQANTRKVAVFNVLGLEVMAKNVVQGNCKLTCQGFQKDLSGQSDC